MEIDARYGKYGVELSLVPAGTLIDYNGSRFGSQGTYSVVWNDEMQWVVEMCRAEDIFPAMVLNHGVGSLVRVMTKTGQPGWLNQRSTVQVIQML